MDIAMKAFVAGDDKFVAVAEEYNSHDAPHVVLKIGIVKLH